MAQWSANDDPTGKPNFANVATVFGVDRTEAQVAGAGVSPGWVKVYTGTGSAELTLVSGGTGYTNSDVITVDGVTTSGVVNATANVVVGLSANVANATFAVTSTEANATVTGVDLTTVAANGDSLAVYTNTSAPQYVVVNQVVNTTFMNITSTWAETNAAAEFAVSGVIETIVPNNGGGSGFTNQSNLAITTSAGQSANVTVALTGRAGRVWYENMVWVKNITNDAEDTIFPDS